MHPGVTSAADATTRVRRAVAAGLMVTVLATALFLGGSVGVGPWDGVYLFRDFVTVPDPVFGANTLGAGGAPRAVPLDAVVAALSTVLPSSLVARLLLVAPLLLVGAGMTVLLRRYGPVATSVGAGLAIANPYVAERLLLGQSPSLLGYAMIPWLVVAVRARRSWAERVLLVLAAALPAALTPVGAVTAAVTVLVTAVVLGPSDRGITRRAGRALDALTLLGPILLLSLPWILAGLRHPTAGASPEGADAFAVRADGPLGVVGSVASLGGVWASGTAPGSRGSVLVVLLQLVLVAAALYARSTITAWPFPARAVPVPTRRALDLAVGAYLATVVSVLLLAGPLLPVWRAAQRVPGVALLRDTHRWLGWAALGVAVLLALGLAVAVDRMGWGRMVAGTLAVVSLAGAVLTVPDVPATLARDVRPVAMPAEFDEIVDLLNDEAQGRVLLLPWQPFRQVDWVGPVQFLDPFPRALEAEVVHARDLLVRRGDQEWLVGGEDPAFATGFASADGVLDSRVLREEGISHVVFWLGSPGEFPRGEEGLRDVHLGEEWIVAEVAPQSP
ncbi:MAG: hypothetical protein GX555_15430 [Actinomycetales bacterium]|nr:hypothetical protein [Actinomycetales bacterium]